MELMEVDSPSAAAEKHAATRQQIAEMREALARFFPWTVTYRHLASFNDVYRLGRKMCRELESRLPPE